MMTDKVIEALKIAFYVMLGIIVVASLLSSFAKSWKERKNLQSSEELFQKMLKNESDLNQKTKDETDIS
jgi:uncharacterized protein YpmB